MNSNRIPPSAFDTAVSALEKQKLDQFEIFGLHRTSTEIESKNLKTEALTQEEDLGLSIRVIHKSRMGFSYTTSLHPDAIQRTVDTACAIARLMPTDPDLNLVNFGGFAYPDVDNFDEKGLAVPIEKKIQIAQDVEQICRSTDSRINGIRSAAFQETRTSVRMTDSTGETISYERTLFATSVTCKAETNGDNQMGSDMDFSSHLESLDFANVAKRAAHWATELLGAGASPTMRCPAILRQNVVAELVEFLSASFSAEEVDKGRSLLAGKEGERLFSENITLIDDRLYPGGYATTPFDAEGIPAHPVTLIDGGVFQQALYNPYYAKKSDTTANSCSSRGLKSPPSIGFSNLYLKPGKKSPKQLLSGISKGILITDLMGLHMANPVTGDFSLGASGILIENGELTRPVRGFAVAGNVMELFRRMTDIGSDMRFFGSVGAPSVRVTELSVGGT